MPSDQDWSPLELTPAGVGADPDLRGLAEYLRRTRVDELVTQAGAVVFRDFRVLPRDLDHILDLLLPNRLAYVHGNSPRTRVGRNIYTSTEYPAEYTVSMHNELSYSLHWPTRLAFYCERAPITGGATPLVDGARWLDALDTETRSAFAGGVRYVQNLHGGRGLGKSWQDTFETDDVAEVEAFLAKTDTTWTWKRHGTLQVSMVRPATRRHPLRGVEVWFNQADQWHTAGLGDDVAADLRAILTEEDLPQSVTFADGSPIPADHVMHVRECGLACAVDVNWRAGDLLLIDNLLVGHGRRPFTGPRRVLVAMSD